MVNSLDADGMSLFKVLQEHLRMVHPDDPGTISYAEVHRRLHLQMIGRNFGESLQIQGLNSLAAWTTSNGLPRLEAIIVREKEGTPGLGFWRSNNRDEIADSLWWADEVAKVRQHDWSKYPESRITGSIRKR
jgi:hypothetical protein